MNSARPCCHSCIAWRHTLCIAASITHFETTLTAPPLFWSLTGSPSELRRTPSAPLQHTHTQPQSAFPHSPIAAHRIPRHYLHSTTTTTTTPASHQRIQVSISTLSTGCHSLRHHSHNTTVMLLAAMVLRGLRCRCNKVATRRGSHLQRQWATLVSFVQPISLDDTLPFWIAVPSRVACITAQRILQ